MSELPPGWTRTTIDELGASTPHALAIGPFGSDLKVADYRSSGVPLIFVRHIRARDFDGLDPKFICETKAEELSAHLVRPGDVVVTKMGEPPGDATVYRGRSQAVLTADCIKLTPHDDLNGSYLSYLIESPQFRAAIRGITQGVAQKKMSLGRFRKLPIPVAPTAEQERIVAAIEEHLSRLDAAGMMLASGLNRVGRLAQSVLASALSTDWPTQPLIDACSVIVDCPHSTAKFVDSGVACVDTTNIEPFRLVEDRLRYVSHETYLKRTKRLEPAEDDVIFAREGTVGTAVRVPPRTRLCLGQRVMLLRAGPGVHAAFLELVMNSPFVRHQYRPLILGTTAPHLNVRDVKALQVPVPSPVEQERAVRSAQEGFRSTDRARTDLELVQRRSAGLRRSLLASAFSGQLVPQDPDDEPASVLLERIRAEREANAPKRKRRARS